jgi:hypothetical protein
MSSVASSDYRLREAGGGCLANAKWQRATPISAGNTEEETNEGRLNLDVATAYISDFPLLTIAVTSKRPAFVVAADGRATP